MEREITLKDVSGFKNLILETETEIEYEEDCVVFQIPVTFNIDKMFGLNVETFENNDWVSIIAKWYPKKPYKMYSDFFGEVELILFYYNNSGEEDDTQIEVFLTPAQKVVLNIVLSKACLVAKNKTLEMVWRDKFLKKKKLIDLSTWAECKAKEYDSIVSFITKNDAVNDFVDKIFISQSLENNFVITISEESVRYSPGNKVLSEHEKPILAKNHSCADSKYLKNVKTIPKETTHKKWPDNFVDTILKKYSETK